MSTCDNTVLTGQEGLIQFKPLGTTNCVDDYCPFMGTRIYLPCSADYDVDDCIEIERVKIPSGEGVSDDGGATVVETGDTYYIVNDGKGVAGDVDACGNDMEGVPYIEVSLVQGGSAISWDTSMAGEAHYFRRTDWRADSFPPKTAPAITAVKRWIAPERRPD